MIRRLAVSVASLLRRPHLFGALLLLGLTGLAIWFAIASLLFEYHFQKARSALASDQFELAKQHIIECLRSSPGSGRTHFLAAQIARRGGDLKVAERELTEAQRFLNMTDDIALERAMLLAQKGDVDAAEFQLRPRIRQGHPQSVRILEALTKGYLRGYRFHEADACLNEWLSYEPDSSEANYLLGWELQQRDLSAESTEAFKRCLDLDPTNSKARYQMAMNYLDNVEPDLALPQFEILARIQPNNSEILVKLARCQHALGQVEEAQSLLDKVLTEQPNNVEALVERGLLASNIETPSVAERYLKQALSHDEFNAKANFAYYRSLVSLGREPEAAQQLNKIKNIDKDKDRIDELLALRIPRFPNNPAFHAEAGIILLRLGSDSEGERMLYRALKLAPGLEMAQNALLEHFQKKNDFKRLAKLKEAIDSGSAIDMAVPF